jgi:menaquinone-specific isochorismate synthase
MAAMTAKPTGSTTGQRLRCRVLRVEADAAAATAGPLGLAGERGFAWRSDARELVTFGSAATVRLTGGPGRLERAAAEVAELLAAIEPEGDGVRGGAAPLPIAVGALPFDDRTPGQLTIPAVTIERAGPGAGTLWVTLVGVEGAMPELPDLGPRRRAPAGRGRGRRGGWPRVTGVRAVQDGGQWRAAVQAALGVIAAGRLDKVVLAREVDVLVDRPFPRAALLLRLAERAPGTFVYADDGFVGASPELLLARTGRHAVARPMAGTVPSGGPSDAEARRIAWLRASGKNANEHRLVIDEVTAALRTVASTLRVHPVEVVRLPTVAHLTTRIDADLGEGERGDRPTALQLAALLHPTPAVAGSPRDAALAAIAELEPFERGRYAGPVGWVDAHGDGEWAIALRCAALDGRRARLWTGAGIVAGSDPESEWYETEAKAAAMLGVLTA